MQGFQSIQIKKEEEIVNSLMPMLNLKLSSPYPQTKVELYEGLHGMKSILLGIEQELNARHEWVAMGIRSGKKEIFNNLLANFHKHRADKNVECRMIFTDKGSDFYKTLGKMRKTEIRVLRQFTPAGIAVYEDKTIIFYYGEKPSFILITNAGVAQSFREFFNGLWKLAKK